MNSEKDFIADSINELDQLIAEATLALSQLRQSASAERADTKQITLLESKINGWVQKRNVLLELLIAPLSRGGKS